MISWYLCEFWWVLLLSVRELTSANIRSDQPSRASHDGPPITMTIWPRRAPSLVTQWRGRHVGPLTRMIRVPQRLLGSVVTFQRPDAVFDLFRATFITPSRSVEGSSRCALAGAGGQQPHRRISCRPITRTRPRAFGPHSRTGISAFTPLHRKRGWVITGNRVKSLLQGRSNSYRAASRNVAA